MPCPPGLRPIVLGRPETWAVLGVLHEMAGRRGVSLAQVALNWVRARPLITSPMLGARSLEQLADNLACLAWRLERGDGPPGRGERARAGLPLRVPGPQRRGKGAGLERRSSSPTDLA